MSDHPSTFRGGSGENAELSWEDGAAIHLRDQDSGVLNGLSALHNGTLGEMVAMISSMPADRRELYVIQKSGDRLIEPEEIAELAKRPDFPG